MATTTQDVDVARRRAAEAGREGPVWEQGFLLHVRTTADTIVGCATGKKFLPINHVGPVSANSRLRPLNIPKADQS